jgi:hypothetical protein
MIALQLETRHTTLVPKTIHNAVVVIMINRREVATSIKQYASESERTGMG